MSEAEKTTRYSNLQLRIASGVLMVILAGSIVYAGGWLLTGFALLLALLMMREWHQMNPQGGWGWRCSGVVYSAAPALSLLFLRQAEYLQSAEASLWAVLYPALMVIATDIGAYIAGRVIGGAKLAPRISPNKTWAGLAGGISCAVMVSFLTHRFAPYPETTMAAILLGATISILAQMGDLLESALKRRFNLKDSGTLIPGHGGVMDRLDGYVFVLPFYFALVFFNAAFIE
jgi:phosphatidate cytidylyltransferase